MNDDAVTAQLRDSLLWKIRHGLFTLTDQEHDYYEHRVVTCEAGEIIAIHAELLAIDAGR